MSNADRESENVESITPFELNKETLQDLDVSAGDAQDVKGGGFSLGIGSETCLTTGAELAGARQLAPYKIITSGSSPG